LPPVVPNERVPVPDVVPLPWLVIPPLFNVLLPDCDPTDEPPFEK
jgi:hypothetical protein